MVVIQQMTQMKNILEASTETVDFSKSVCINEDSTMRDSTVSFFDNTAGFFLRYSTTRKDNNEDIFEI